MKKLLLLLLTGFSAQLARAQAPGMPMVYGRMNTSQKGFCVLPDSSRVEGKITIIHAQEAEDVTVKVKTPDGQQQEYTPAQLAYMQLGKTRYRPVGDFGPDAGPAFGEVQAWGTLQVLSYNDNSMLLIRRRGAREWVQAPARSGPFANLKNLRETLGPLVADQPAYATALADGRITHDNLLQFIRSYNSFVAKQP
ncbi:hypothetical protein GCM10027048_37960 [Hymenobacter coalescens]